MKQHTSYKVKIKNYNRIFNETLLLYREAVEFYTKASISEWDNLSQLKTLQEKQRYMEVLSHKTKNNLNVKYEFDRYFYKFPSYLRRSAISEAIGKVSSYKTLEKEGKHPGKPKAGRVFPVMYKNVMYNREGDYKAKIKIYIRNTWDWLEIELKKSDVDYIKRHCSDRKECPPTLVNKGKQWYLVFSFEETVSLKNTPTDDQIVVGVDLGINSACACVAMKSDGTVIDRAFLNLPIEEDCLTHSINRIKKAQKNNAKSTPRLWGKAKGINDRISVLNARFIEAFAIKNNADVIIFEHLDKTGKKKGNKKQRMHMWKTSYVQNMVTLRAHRNGMRIRTVNPKNTSALAFDGSGRVTRNIGGNYSICKFTTGKIYNCDLNAAYNIASRYFVKEKLKSLPATLRLGIEAKVPGCTKRNTCTLSTLISLNAEIAVA